MTDPSQSPEFAAASPADLARQARSEIVLAMAGIPFNRWLPPRFEAATTVRTPPEIAQRLVGAYATAVYADYQGSGKGLKASQEAVNAIESHLGIDLEQFLTPGEMAYLRQATPSGGDNAKFSWRYECCHVFLWALGFIPTLGVPCEECDVDEMAMLLKALSSFDDLLPAASPQPKEVLRDAADLILRYNWACVDARLNHHPAPAGLNGEVAVEWHHAFNWLVGPGDDWDHISTDT
ncbi:MAG: DUF4272 domain-containing protein [Bifidobacteriaceae bacterium]|jgi:hypothetical protein|nr:DUF4272 domain-containing protein [Bifidobacteriaceae bacterium]